MAANTELNDEASRVHAALENLAPEQADIGPMTPDELNSLIKRSGTHQVDGGASFSPPTGQEPTMGTAPPPAPPAAPQQAARQQDAPPPSMPPPPQYAPPPPQQRTYDPRVEQLWNENRMLAEKAARADQIDEWMAQHPEVLENIINGAANPVPPGTPPEEVLAQEVRRIRRENEMTRQYADQRSREARRMAELSVEATQILHEYGGQIDIQALAQYAHRNGIPNLRDALTHAAGAVTLQNMHQQRTMAQQPQNYGYAPQQYPQNYGYPPQQQGYPQYPQTYAPAEPPPPPPAPPQASVMRPGMAIQDRPAFRGPARNSDEAYGQFESFLREQGALS